MEGQTYYSQNKSFWCFCDQHSLIPRVQCTALATQCRDAAFRESMSASSWWMQAATTLDAYMKQLETQIDNSSRHDENNVETVKDNDGLGYTFQVDCQSPTVESLQGEFAPPKPVVVDSDPVINQVDSMVSIFRFLRNACAGCSENQSACLDAGLIKLAHQVVLQCCFWMDVEDEALKDRFILLAQVALQFCVNSVTSNLKTQAHVWQLFFPDHFQKILVECHRHRKVVAFAVALIMNCINSKHLAASEAENVATRRIDLVCARNLVITILQRCIVQPLPSDASLAKSRHLDDQDPAFEWICALFSVLFRENCATELYNAVGAHLLSRLWSRVTPEQLILLRMFTMWASSLFKPLSETLKHEEQDTEQVPSLVQNTFVFIKRTWIDIITTDDEERPDEADKVRKKVWLELENEAKLMLLDVLGDVTVGPTTFDSKETQELVLSLLEELQRVWNLGRSNFGPRATGSTVEPELYAEPFGYRSGLIRVLGNLSFRRREHQDLIREKGFLPLFLNHCNIDERNPMIREWALVALRNLCEGNEANQDYINALRPQGMDAVATAALEKVNVDARMEDNGRVKLTRRDRGGSYS